MIEKNVKTVVEKFMMMIEKLSSSSRKPRDYGTDVDIYRSEIHIMKVIGDYSNLHVSEIARKFRVTKGAISQILKKLERKGLVEKYLDETNNTRLLVKLTDKGRGAYEHHEEYHRKYDKDIFTYLEELDDHELEVLLTFIEKVSDMAEKHM
ncbi:MAG: MarR family transcriptional regulator [Anaeromicrobium sp.]|jgi:DNA-binding MarR family transcriptional regulator|uniref:MarR family winged helix-turn-helix transcriptional regulator n=1 Tax=Anaeromicrobium sp. TaxID=1929132 RepID=UPI0025E065BF|nr:MarR family transcriptional regulator [Anaeromicrobium sp.]MCT4593834.1 MarR family transcriptional regulator [Anaeromicrobium sp.]